MACPVAVVRGAANLAVLGDVVGPRLTPDIAHLVPAAFPRTRFDQAQGQADACRPRVSKLVIDDLDRAKGRVADRLEPAGRAEGGGVVLFAPSSYGRMRSPWPLLATSTWVPSSRPTMWTSRVTLPEGSLHHVTAAVTRAQAFFCGYTSS
jgi:hypothetical protein